MRLNDFTGVGRSIDPRYPTNAAILVCMGVAWLATGSSRAASMVFFAWAFSRELDPDREWTAFLSVALVAPLALAAPQVAVGPLFWLLLATRVVNRTSGVPPTWLDAGFVVWLAFASDGLSVALLSVAAFGLDAWLPGGRRREWLWALAALGVALALAGRTSFETATLWQALLALPLLGLARATRQVASTDDVAGAGMLPVRVHWGQALVGAALVAGLLDWGEWWSFGPVWTALWGSSLGRLLWRKRRRQEVSLPAGKLAE